MADDYEVIQVGDLDPTKRNSEIEGDEDPGDKAQVQVAMCWFNGRQYGEGAVVCTGGRAIICNRDGRWAQYGKC